MVVGAMFFGKNLFSYIGFKYYYYADLSDINEKPMIDEDHYFKVLEDSGFAKMLNLRCVLFISCNGLVSVDVSHY